MVIGVKQEELVTGDGSGNSPFSERMIASAQTLPSWLAICPAFGWVVADESLMIEFCQHFLNHDSLFLPNPTRNASSRTS